MMVAEAAAAEAVEAAGWAADGGEAADCGVVVAVVGVTAEGAMAAPMGGAGAVVDGTAASVA
jgi:hypothetical protein